MVSYDDVERLLDYGRESRHMMVSYDDVERLLNVAGRQKNWSASSKVAGRQKNWSASLNVAVRQENWSASLNVAVRQKTGVRSKWQKHSTYSSAECITRTQPRLAI